MSSLRDHYDRITEPYPPESGGGGDIDGDTIAGLVTADREIICVAKDFTNQTPVGTNTPIQLTWGPAVNTPSDDVNIDATGNIFINVTGNYHFRSAIQYSRTTGTGRAWLWFRYLINGVQEGDTALVNLNNTNTSMPLYSDMTATLPAGVVVTGQMWRGNEGTDDGGVVSNAASLSGSAPTPSAKLTISKYKVVATD